MQQRLAILASAILCALGATSASARDLTSTVEIKIEAQPLASALLQFATQTDVQIMTLGADVRELKTIGLAGRMTVGEALQKLLEGSGLSFKLLGESTVGLVRSDARSSGAAGDRVATSTRLAQAESAPRSGRARDEQESANAGKQTVEEITPAIDAIPEILVTGSRTLNMDIRRTEDDAQPYVVFSGEDVQRSNATSLEDFFRTRLPMNTVQTVQTQNNGSVSGNFSSINLRGLGTNQTLILVDGRRVPSVSTSGQFQQPDINGIPLSSIERIEVLPTTASAIHGGGATGGVINIITRKDYTGVDLAATYGGSFRGDAANKRIDASAGIALLEGRTHVQVTGSHASADPFTNIDRDFLVRARELQLANNANGFYSLTTPPLGNATNIRSENGSNLVLDDGTPLNSPITSIPAGYAGPASDGGAALFANAGRYNLDVPLDPNSGQRDLVYGSEQSSASASVRHEFSESIALFADVSWRQNEGLIHFASPLGSATLAADSPLNPFRSRVVVRFPTLGLSLPPVRTRDETLGAIGGLIVRLPARWTAEADYSWSRATHESASTTFGVGDPDAGGPALSPAAAAANGSLNVMRDLTLFPVDWTPYLLPSPNAFTGPADATLTNATLRLSGPVVRLPAGDLTLTGLVEWREERNSEDFSSSTISNPPHTYFPPRSQEVLPLYAEAKVPLVSAANSIPFVRELDVQASVRWEEYKTRASNPAFVQLADPSIIPAVAQVANEVSHTSYLFGLRYLPCADIAIRASYGTGFLPPSISQITPSILRDVTPNIADPKRGGQPATVPPLTQIGGGNPQLTPETSRSWSLGMILTPRFAEQLRISLDYTNIRKTNEISSNVQIATIMNLENLLPGRVVRLPLSAQDAALGYTGGVITQIDVSALNIATAAIEAWDVQADYTFAATALGQFQAYLAATYQPTLQRTPLPGTDAIENAGYDTGVLEWRGNAGVNWNRGPWSVGWNAQYYDSYFIYAPGSLQATIDRAVLNQGSAKVRSQIYHDLVLRYRVADSRRKALAGTELSIGIQNLFDESPPITATTGAFAGRVGGYSNYGDPRLRRFTVTLRKAF